MIKKVVLCAIFLLLFIGIASAATVDITCTDNQIIRTAFPDNSWEGFILQNTVDPDEYYYVLLEFYDITDVPADSTITSATLYVYCSYSSFSGESFNTAYWRVTSSWDNETVTYNTAPTYADQNGFGINNIDAWNSDNMMNLFTQWYDGTYTNYGLFMTATVPSGAGQGNFGQYEGATSAYIKVVYTAPTPAPVNIDSTNGAYWINTTWEAGAGTITDSYNVSQNTTWVNGSTALFNNSTVSYHGWSDVIVFAYNDTMGVSSSSISLSTQAANVNPVISNLTNVLVYENEVAYFYADATDAEGDGLNYTCDREDLFTFDSTTGTGSWTPTYDDNGTYDIDIGVHDVYGGTDNQTIRINVYNSPVPPDPIKLTNITGNFYVNYSWQKGIGGNITDSWNVLQNGSWTNGTTQNWSYDNIGAHGSSHIRVYAYNDSGNISKSYVTDSITLSNNPITLTNTSNTIITENETVYIYADFTDADGDSPTFWCSRTDLFTFDTSTGTGSWKTNYDDNGTYNIELGVIDGYGSTGNATVKVNVYKNNTFTANISTIKDTYVYEFSSGTNYDGYTYLLSGCAVGASNRERYTYVEFDLSSIPENALVTGASLNIHQYSADVAVTNLAIYRVTSSWDATTVTWGDKPTHTAADSYTIKTNSGASKWHNVDVLDTVRGWKNGTYDNYGFSIWNVTAASSFSPGFNSSEGLYGKEATLYINYAIYTPPDPIILTDITGNFYVNYSWQKGIGGNITDVWRVLQNGTWTNDTTANWSNDVVGFHGTSDIKVYAYNTTSGTLSNSYVIDSNTVPNNDPVLTNVSNTIKYENETVYFYADSTDLESDGMNYTCDREDLFTFNSLTGTGSWKTDYTDNGTYYIDIGVHDTYGAIDNQTIKINIYEDTATPPNPIILTNITGNFYVNYSWQKGTGNVTDSWNVLQNGSWNNATTQNWSNVNVGAHGYSMVRVYAYNDSGNTSKGYVTDNVTVPNNDPVLTNLSNIIQYENLTVYVYADFTDAEGDSGTFWCSRTDLFTFDTSTGTGSWTPDHHDNGSYDIDFGITDSYDAVDNQTIRINVYNNTATPPNPCKLSNLTGNFYVNYSWQKGTLGNMTDSWNVLQNGTWTNDTTQNWSYENVGAHGYSMIRVYAYNATGNISRLYVTDNVTVTNNAPVVPNASIHPTAPNSIDNLTSNNGTVTDAEGDPITLTYKWYKDGVNMTALTNSTWVKHDNTSDDEVWKVGIIPNDGYVNGSEVFSGTVTIGSGNSAPTLTALLSNQSSKKYNYDVKFMTENAVDSDGDHYTLSVGSASGLNDICNSTDILTPGVANCTIEINWTSGSRTFYGRLYDGIDTSTEYTTVITCDTTPPIVNSSDVNTTAITQGDSVLVSADIGLKNGTITTPKVKIMTPEGVSTNYSLTGTGANGTYTYVFTPPSAGNWFVTHIYAYDDSGNVVDESVLHTIGVTAVTGAPTGGVGGGAPTIIKIGDLNLTPDLRDTFILYSALKGDQTATYEFVANRNITSCEIKPNHNAKCEIVNGYVVLVTLTVNETVKSYNGVLTVTDEWEYKADAVLIVRILKISHALPFIQIDVGEFEQFLNIIFEFKDTTIIGIRTWFVGLIGLGFIGAILLAYKKRGTKR